MRACAGFTLLEVLVALFVVALGVAGAASVQAMAVRAAGEAAHLSDGMRLAASLAERMHANPLAMALPDGANPYLGFEALPGSAAVAVSGCYASVDCDPAQLARFDLAETVAVLRSSFPGGRLRICRDDRQPDASGRLPWDCSEAAGAPAVIKLGWRAPAGRSAASAGDDAPAVVLVSGDAAP